MRCLQTIWSNRSVSRQIERCGRAERRMEFAFIMPSMPSTPTPLGLVEVCKIFPKKLGEPQRKRLGVDRHPRRSQALEREA